MLIMFLTKFKLNLKFGCKITTFFRNYQIFLRFFAKLKKNGVAAAGFAIFTRNPLATRLNQLSVFPDNHSEGDECER